MRVAKAVKEAIVGGGSSEAGSLFFLASASHIQISYRTIPKRPGLERSNPLDRTPDPTIHSKSGIAGMDS